MQTAKEPSAKIKFVIAYDGTAYQGWQTQKIGLGVQQKLEEALAKIFPSAPKLHSSSRTDTGVHARGMVAHFEVPRNELRMASRKLLLAVNCWLPDDVRVMQASRAPDDFHARFDAAGKQYRYFIWNDNAMDPLMRRTAWHVPKPVDVSAMKSAAAFFSGKHDFRSFTTNTGYERTSTIRTLSKCGVRKSGKLITVIIEGDGFLYRMCRGIVGTLVQVGHGKFRPEVISEMLARKDRRVGGMSAPAHGLILWKVFYAKK